MARQNFQSLTQCQDKMLGTDAPAVHRTPAMTRIPGVPEKVRSNDNEKRPVSARPDHAVAAAPGAPPAFDREIRQVAARYRIDPLLLHAMVRTESAYRPRIRSHAGALGLMQVMPATGAELGVDSAGLLDPLTNLDTGARHLKRLQKRYGHDFGVILSAYNAGGGAVARYGNRIPPFAETRAYVTTVLKRYGALRSALAEQSR
ncbi:MAG: lytic transglycosylase domain-containing protein [Novosphingobium sp.]